MATPAIVGSAKGFPAVYGSHIQNVWSTAQGDSVVISPTAGNTLVAVVFGLSDPEPFDLLHTGNTNQAFLPDLLSFNAAPTVADNSAAPVATITNVALTSNVVTITAANVFQVGDTVKLAGLTTATFLNNQTVTVASASGSQFTAPFTHANYTSAADTGTATRTSSGNDWVAAGGQINLGGGDYTASLGDFTRQVKWALDGYLPSVFMFYALNVAGGSQTVTVKSCYLDGTTRPTCLAAGKPIFDGGLDVHILEFSGIVTASASDGSQGQLSAANPAITPSFTTTTAGDMILTAGIMKNNSAFSTYAPAGTTGTTLLASGKCVGSQAHWGIQMQLQTSAGAITPGFTNPLQYEMAVMALALKHS
jgi:hypothetical protein